MTTNKEGGAMWIIYGVLFAILLLSAPAEAATRTTLQSAATATGNGTIMSVDDKGAAGVTVTGSFVGTISFEGSADGGVTWSAKSCNRLATPGGSTTTTTTGQFLCDVAGLSHFRAPVSAYTSGSITVIGTASNASTSGGFLFDENGNLVTTLGNAIEGEDFANHLMKVAPQARAGGGATGKRQISVGTTEDEFAVCTAPCTLYSITATNINAAVRYIKCNNADASTTAPGTSVPEIDLAIPGATTGAGITFAFPVGLDFDTALTCWLVTGAAESDVAEVAANELKVLYSYKQ